MDTQEFRLALLYEVIDKLEDSGKIQLQKLVYFLQEASKLPTRYGFKMHHYGPYSEDLDTDMTRLKLTGYVDVQPDAQGYGFHITSVDSPKTEWLSIIEPYSQKIEQTINIFGNKQAYELELAATIHFVSNLAPASSKDDIVDKVKSLKPRFEKDYISKFQSDLEELGFL